LYKKRVDDVEPTAFGGGDTTKYHTGLKPYIGLHTLGEVHFAAKGEPMHPSMKSFDIAHLNIEVHKQTGGHPLFKLKSTKVMVTARQWCIDVYRYLILDILRTCPDYKQDKINKWVLTHPINNVSPLLTEELTLAFKCALAKVEEELDEESSPLRNVLFKHSHYDTDNRISLIDESMAALFCNLDDIDSKKETNSTSILMFDCGAYTCDASLFKVSSEEGGGAMKLSTVALCGSSHINGDQITSSLTDLIIERAEGEAEEGINVVNQNYIWRKVESGKRELCNESDCRSNPYTIVCTYDDSERVIVDMSVNDVTSVCKEKWQSFIDSSDESIKKFFNEVIKQLQEGTIDYMIPVGGGLRNNILRSILEKWVTEKSSSAPKVLNNGSLNSNVAKGRLLLLICQSRMFVCLCLCVCLFVCLCVCLFVCTFFVS